MSGPNLDLGVVVENHRDLERSAPRLLLVEHGLYVLDTKASLGKRRNDALRFPLEHLSGGAVLDANLSNFVLSGRSWCSSLSLFRGLGLFVRIDSGLLALTEPFERLILSLLGLCWHRRGW